MKNFLGILGSILITVLIIAGVGITLTVVFRDRVPILEEVPEPKVYAGINRREYVVATRGIENAENPTVIYESTGWELERYGQELRYISGKIEPLTSLYDPAISPDIPTDVFPKSEKGASSSSTTMPTAEPVVETKTEEATTTATTAESTTETAATASSN